MRFILALFTVVIWHGPVCAFPNYAVLYKSTYTYLPSCAVCHDSNSWELNKFGKHFREKGRDFKALKAIENLDSDGDGIINDLEIIARSNPGDPQSTPQYPGFWLKDPAIHPPTKLLKAAFPGASFEVREFELGARQFQSLSKRWKAPLPDESSLSVLFPASKGGALAGLGTYLSMDIPGRRENPSLLFICSDPTGRLLHLKIIKYTGSSSLSKGKAWKDLLGKTIREITDDQSISGPLEEILAVKGAIIRGLLVIQASVGLLGEATNP